MNGPVAERARRVPQTQRRAIERELEEMLGTGIIWPFDSAWVLPVVLVNKPSEEIRFCIDYQRLNKITRPDRYPMPCIDDLLDQLASTMFIFTLDLTRGYWKLEWDESAKERSAFMTHKGLFEFNVFPFELKNAPATFQRAINKLLRGLEGFAVAYLGDVPVFSHSWEKHLEHLWLVLEESRRKSLP